MNLNRRSFMQMLGLGGMGALATQAGASIPLFGSDSQSSSLWTPGDRTLLQGHWVLKQKRLLERVPESEISPRYQGNVGARVVGRLVRNRTPQNIVASRTMTLTSVAHSVDGTVRDAHAAFYLASRELRAQFAEKSLAFLSDPGPIRRGGSTLLTSQESRAVLSLVTIVKSEIHARPLLAHPDEEEPSPGAFEVACQYEQYLVADEPLSVLQTFESYSETGDYPVDLPKDIDLGLLLRADHILSHQGKGYSSESVHRILRRLVG